MSAPLEGIRVLDLSRLLPGAVCTLHLADLGADVVKVEDTGRGDYARSLGIAPGAAGGSASGAVSAFYRMVNRNKRSLALDLKAGAGRDAFLRLAQRADVIVESFRPGVIDRLGVGYANVAAINPRLVYCSITGYGQTGPYRDRPGHDINYLGYAGVLDQTGTADGAPALSNLQVADLLGGAMNAATAILAALFGAARRGRGAHVDIAMTDGALAHNIFALHAIETLGHAQPRGRDLLTGGVPCYGVYATEDSRYLAVGALEAKFWRALCDAL
ncbi:MAG: CaiB/BaiF CoA transferase family protein, partial [Burkholderiales bacterium]